MSRLLLVCTGNTCRSPMAEALLRRKLQARGIEDVEVESAGTGAWDGAPASEAAYLVSLEHGLDLSGHRARMLTRDLAAEADLVLTMSRHHGARLAQLGAAEKTHLLAEYGSREGGGTDIADPFGSDLDAYRETFTSLDTLLDGVVERLGQERLGDRR